MFTITDIKKQLNKLTDKLVTLEKKKLQESEDAQELSAEFLTLASKLKTEAHEASKLIAQIQPTL